MPYNKGALHDKSVRGTMFSETPYIPESTNKNRGGDFLGATDYNDPYYQRTPVDDFIGMFGYEFIRPEQLDTSAIDEFFNPVRSEPRYEAPPKKMTETTPEERRQSLDNYMNSMKGEDSPPKEDIGPPPRPAIKDSQYLDVVGAHMLDIELGQKGIDSNFAGIMATEDAKSSKTLAAAIKARSGLSAADSKTATELIKGNSALQLQLLKNEQAERGLRSAESIAEFEAKTKQEIADRKTITKLITDSIGMVVKNAEELSFVLGNEFTNTLKTMIGQLAIRIRDDGPDATSTQNTIADINDFYNHNKALAERSTGKELVDDPSINFDIDGVAEDILRFNTE